LRWVSLNGSSKGFVRSGKNQVRVLLEVLRKGVRHQIVREKGSRNLYCLDGKKYASFRDRPPEDVAKTLALTETNFQGQFDAPFWFGETAGEVSRQLNKIVDLEIIDRTLGNAGAAVRRCQERVAVCKERLQKAKSEHEQLYRQQERIRLFNQLRESSRGLRRLQSDTSNLESLVACYRSYQERALQERLNCLEEVFRLATEARKSCQAAVLLGHLLEEIQENKRQAALEPPHLRVLEDSYQRWKALQEKEQSLSGAVHRYLDLQQEVERLLVRRKQVEKRVIDRLKGESCPLCGAPLQ